MALGGGGRGAGGAAGGRGRSGRGGGGGRGAPRGRRGPASQVGQDTGSQQVGRGGGSRARAGGSPGGRRWRPRGPGRGGLATRRAHIQAGGGARALGARPPAVHHGARGDGHEHVGCEVIYARYRRRHAGKGRAARTEQRWRERCPSGRRRLLECGRRRRRPVRAAAAAAARAQPAPPRLTRPDAPEPAGAATSRPARRTPPRGAAATPPARRALQRAARCRLGRGPGGWSRLPGAPPPARERALAFDPMLSFPRVVPGLERDSWCAPSAAAKPQSPPQNAPSTRVPRPSFPDCSAPFRRTPPFARSPPLAGAPIPRRGARRAEDRPFPRRFHPGPSAPPFAMGEGSTPHVAGWGYGGGQPRLPATCATLPPPPTGPSAPLDCAHVSPHRLWW